MPPGLFSDPNLQTVRIADFTPGVVRFSRGAYPDTYAPSAPPGSASLAYRCWAIPNVGLGPFFYYYPAQTYTRPAHSYPQMVSLASMLPLPGLSPGADLFADSIVAAFFSFGNNGGWYEIMRTNTLYRGSPSTGTRVFASSGAGTPIDPWVSMDYALFADTAPQSFRRVVLTNDVYDSNWVTIGSWQSPATPPQNQVGPLPGPSAYTVRLLYHENRAGFFHASTPADDTAGFGGAGQDFLSVSDILSLSNWNFSGVYFGELGQLIATWGSISTGELFILYTVGGAVLINGDLLAPTSAIKLPGVVGPGAVFGRAAQTAAGLIYATETDGAYLWNGDNTSQKISNNVPDDELIRTSPGGFDIVRLHSSQAAWGAQVMFPNNWLFDTVTGGWWQVEDPAVVNFQVHAPSSYGPKSFLSGQGFVLSVPNVPPTLTIYAWDRLTYQSTYEWVSNPLPVTSGALVNIQAVEIVASNPTPTDAIITITPTIPTSQIPFQNPNQNQPASFRIPAQTVAWRGSQRLGYTDYNIQIRVDARNVAAADPTTRPTNPAPTLHEFTIGYTQTRTSGVQ